MQLEVGQVGRPHERGQVLAEAVVDLLRARVDPRGLDPRRPVLGAVLLVKELAFHAIGVALERERAVAQVGQHGVGHPRVVVDHLPLGEAHRRVHHLVEVRQAEAVAADLHLHPLGSRHYFFAVVFFFDREPLLAPLDAAAFLVGFLSAVPPWRLVPLIEASRAAIRSGTFWGSSSGASTTTSWPSAFRSIMSSTRSRYSSRYLSGSNSAVSESISCMAISTSRALVLALPSEEGMSSIPSGGTTSSPKSIVSMVRTSPSGRIATRFSLERITTRAIATLPDSFMASSSSL